MLGKATEAGPSVEAPANCVGDLYRVPGSQLQPGPGPVNGNI